MTASASNDNSLLYTPVRITNPEDITGGGGAGSSTITAPLGSKLSAASVSVVVASDQAAIPITDNSGSLTVDGTVTANIGTSGSLATAAKQPALGTAGTASADVITVQGAASMKEILVQLIAGTAAFGKLSANTAATYIGDVVVPLSTTPFQATDTLTTAGTRQTLASHGSNVFGFYITNTHASATVYIGVAATVSSTAFIFRLAPGQSTPLIPLSNSNVLGFDASANSATITYGGF